MKVNIDRFFRDGKVYILPTRLGALYFGLLALTIIVAIALANNLAFLFAAMLLTVLMASMVQAHFNLTKIKVEQVTSSLVAEHDPLVFQFKLYNRGLEEKFGIQAAVPPFLKQVDPRSIGLRGHGHENLQAVGRASSRGVYRVDWVKLESRFPFGLWRTWSWHQVSSEVTVYPRPDGEQPLPSPKPSLAEGAVSGGTGGDDFSDHRRYQPFDNLRHVDWKAVGRGHPYLIKRFDDGAAPTQVLDLKDVASAELEPALRQLTRWVLDCDRDGVNYGLQLGGKTSEVSHSSRHLQQCLRSLATYGAKGGDVEAA